MQSWKKQLNPIAGKSESPALHSVLEPYKQERPKLASPFLVVGFGLWNPNLMQHA